MYDAQEIIDAAKRIENEIYETPLFENSELNAIVGGRVFLNLNVSKEPVHLR